MELVFVPVSYTRLYELTNITPEFYRKQIGWTMMKKWNKMWQWELETTGKENNRKQAEKMARGEFNSFLQNVEISMGENTKTNNGPSG